ncbi:MAG: DUF2797 domain-containing protein, partial [Streptosporangiaceae bacterium]
MEDTEAWLGIDWSGDIPAARLARPGSPGRARLVPLQGELRFRVTGSAARYCTGWFDLTGPEARHVVCRTWEQFGKGRQCRSCQYLEGMVAAHQGYDKSLSQMPPNLRGYLTQPHRLYLDIFADGTSKVGTVAEQRLASRLAEQGPVAACYVARARDGLQVRQLEAAVSRRLGLPQAVTATRKLRALTAAVDVAALHASLSGLAARACVLAAETVSGDGWSPIDPPEAWKLPAISAAVFAAAPLALYPLPLTAGEHSLTFRGLAGPVAMVTTTADDGAPLYVVNLGDLGGVAVTFGEYQSPALGPEQATL